MKFVLLYAVALLSASPLMKNAVGQETKPSQSRVTTGQSALQGTWHAVASTSNGTPLSKDVLTQLTMLFAGDTVSIMGAAPTHFQVDETVTAAYIDFLDSLHSASGRHLQTERWRLGVVRETGRRPSHQFSH